jgi:hypothetical protein
MEEEKRKPPMAVVHESRLPFFQPTRKPTVVSKWYVETSWGHLEITGRLGQGHRDVVDVLLAKLEGAREIDGRLIVLTDAYILRKTLSQGRSLMSYDYIKKMLEELSEAKVRAFMNIDGREFELVGTIISEYLWNTDLTRPVKAGAFGTNVQKIKVWFGQGWTKLLKEDMPSYYKIEDMVELQYGISQATARYCMAHKIIHDSIDGILEKIGYIANGRSRQAVEKAKKELQKDAPALLKMGITVEKTTIHKK